MAHVMAAAVRFRRDDRAMVIFLFNVREELLCHILDKRMPKLPGVCRVSWCARIQAIDPAQGQIGHHGLNMRFDKRERSTMEASTCPTADR